MKSRTKNHLTNTQIEALIQANFGRDVSAEKIEELNGGMCNCAYAIELSDKTRVVLKVSMAPDAPLLWHEGDNMAAEIEAYALVGRYTTIPIPRIICADFGKTRINSRYFFMEYMSGETLTKAARKMSADNLDRIKRELAGYLAQLHRIEGDYFGYLTTGQTRRYASWKEANARWFREILSDAEKRRYHLPYRRIENILPKAYAYLESVKSPRLIHNDFWAGNVFVARENGEYEIQCVTDFERAAWGDPLAEFHFNAGIFDNIWEQPAFWKSYAGTDQKLDRDDIVRIHIYRLYLWLVMTAETYRYPRIVGWGQRVFAGRMIAKSLAVLEKA